MGAKRQGKNASVFCRWHKQMQMHKRMQKHKQMQMHRHMQKHKLIQMHEHMNKLMQKQMHKQHAKAALAVVLLVCLVALAILPGMVNSAHAEHEHSASGTDNNCAVCVFFANISNLFKQFSVAFAYTFPRLASLLFATATLYHAAPNSCLCTPILLKTRLNN